MLNKEPMIRGKKHITFFLDWQVDSSLKPFVALALDYYTRKYVRDMLTASCGAAKYYIAKEYQFKPENYKGGMYINIFVDSIDGIQRAAEFDLNMCQYSLISEGLKFDHKIITYGFVQPRVLSDEAGNFWTTDDVVAGTWKAPNENITFAEPMIQDRVNSRCGQILKPTHFTVIGEMNAVNKKMGQLRAYMRNSRNWYTMMHNDLNGLLQSNQAVVYAVDRNRRIMTPLIHTETWKQVDIQSVNHFLLKIGYKPLGEVEFT